MEEKGKKQPHEFVPYGQRWPGWYQAAQCCKKKSGSWDKRIQTAAEPTD